MENGILMSFVAQRKQVFNLMTPTNTWSEEGSKAKYIYDRV